MSRYTQIHILTPYAPSNLNRDDLGRPKTAIVGGKQRLRISSQSLKRAWRTSDLFKEALEGHIGVRTRTYGRKILQQMEDAGIPKEKAIKWTRKIVDILGKPVKESSENPADTEQLAHLSPDEMTRIDKLVEDVIANKKEPTKDQLSFLADRTDAVDVALFGRMLANSPEYNVEAAAQVAHAFTIHEAAVEDDFFTAVDDLNKDRDETGSGHMGDLEFGSGVYYVYLTINRERLAANLDGDQELADKAVDALIRAAAQVSPTGKLNSFASHSCAHYMLVEQGDHQPRSLASAFFRAVKGEDVLQSAIEALEGTKDLINKAYGTKPMVEITMNVPAGTGSLEDVCAKVRV